MSYLGDTTITISTKDMVAIANSALGIPSVADSVSQQAGVNIGGSSVDSIKTYAIWGGVGLLAYFMLRK